MIDKASSARISEHGDKPHQFIRKSSPTARNSRNATCGTRLGAPSMERRSSVKRDRMQPRSAAFNTNTVGFCMTHIGSCKVNGQGTLMTSGAYFRRWEPCGAYNETESMSPLH